MYSLTSALSSTTRTMFLSLDEIVEASFSINSIFFVNTVSSTTAFTSSVSEASNISSSVKCSLLMGNIIINSLPFPSLLFTSIDP